MTQLFKKSPCRAELPEEREKIGERVQKWACEMEEVVISMRVCASARTGQMNGDACPLGDC